MERGAVLRLHDQRHRDQEHGQGILQHDEDLAEGHFRRAAEGAAHDVDGLVAPGQQGREQAGKGTYHPDQQRIDQQITRGQMYADGHVGIVQQAVDGRCKGIGQQQAEGETHRSEQDGLCDVFPDDGTFLCAEQPPHRHLPGPLAREGEGKIDVIEDGRKEQQQADDGQQPQGIRIAVAEGCEIELLEKQFVEPRHIEFLEETGPVEVVPIDFPADLFHLVVNDSRIGTRRKLHEHV